MHEGENIREELKLLVPEIPWNGKSADFSLPQDYFRRVSREISEKIDVQEAEKVLTKAPAYLAPRGYFDQFPDAVWKKIRSEQRTVSLPRYRPRRHEWAIAAAIAVIVALGGLLSLFRHPDQPSLNTQLATLSDKTIEQYLYSQLSSLSTEEIYDYLNPEDQQQVITDDFSSQDIEEYLNNNMYAPDGL